MTNNEFVFDISIRILDFLISHCYFVCRCNSIIGIFLCVYRYSVGAHIAGLTSNFIKTGKIGRITGLDPTIIFYMSNNRSRDLDPTDAHFVDVIHTAAGILGQWGPSGHADFYVNGGTSQPGCASDSIIRKYKVLPCTITSIENNFRIYSVQCK